MKARFSFVIEVGDGKDAREIALAVRELLWQLDAGPESIPVWETVDGGEEEG